MLLDQRVLAVEGDGVEIEVERRPPSQPQPTDRIEPVAHQPGVATRRHAATVLGEERALGDRVESGEEGQPFVEDIAHDVTVARVAEELQGQQRPQGTAGRDHVRSGEAAARQDRVDVGGAQVGQEEEQPAELGVDGPRSQVELTDIRHISRNGPGSAGPLVVGPSRQLGEALFLEDGGDGRRAERLAVTGQGPADVVDREVLLAEGDDLLPQPSLLAGRPALVWSGDKEVAVGLVAELVDEDAEAPRRVAETSGRLGGWEALDEERSERLILSMGGVGGLQEAAGEC